MTRLLVDTSAYSAFLRGEPLCVDALRHARELVLTPVVLGELRAGFMKGSHREKNEGELEEFLASPRVRVEVIDDDTSRFYAVAYLELSRRGSPIPTNDLWIAASALQHGLTILTGDRHFLSVPNLLVELLPAVIQQS